MEIEIRVLREGEESGSDRSDWSNVGIGKYTKPSTKTEDKSSSKENSEHESTPDNGPADSPYVSNVPHPTLTYSCYYCEKDGIKFETGEEVEYQKHGDQKHRDKPMYPNEATLEKHSLKPQGKEWEI